MAQYGRYNNVVDLYEEGPFASSDHDPIIVGLDAAYEEAPAPIDFRDVRSSHPDYTEIQWAAGSGIVLGGEDGTFRPSTPLDRGTLAEALHAAAGSPEVEDPSGDARADAIAWLQAEGLDEGIVDGEDFRPSARVDRAETAAWLYRLDRL